MAAAVAKAIPDVIGVVGSVLTIAGFFGGNVAAPKPEGATVMIKSGLPDLKSEEDSLGGSINKIYVFDWRNGYAGEASGGKLGSGDVLAKTVDQTVKGQTAGYIAVSNDDDATCISWISVTQFDGENPGAWTGDIGYHCGQSWYNSLEPAGDLKDGSGKFIPRCTWLDANGSNDIESAALKFSVDAYGSAVNETIGNNACAPTIFGSDNGPIAGAPAKRSQRIRPSWMKQSLVMSNHAGQAAQELCESATSWGPDFVGSDGRFCDMDAKTLHPLCSCEDVDDCVEIDDEAKVVKKRSTVASRSVHTIHRSYSKVSKWGY